jgi:5'-3' exonuclease
VAAAPLLLVDAPALLYRAFYALPKSITGPGGKPVNALLGTVNYLLRTIEDRPPRAVVTCFGQESAHYRVGLYRPYHRARPPMPAELRDQWEVAPRLFEAFGWYVAEHGDLEADDLLAAHAEAEARAGGHALILTGDRDMYQCASERVTVLFVRTGRQGPEEVGPAEVQERYGVAPELVPDFIALRGDPSDGLPGAPGIGPKGAAALLQRHGSLEKVLEGADESPRFTGVLRKHRDELLVFKDIATLRPPLLEPVADRPTDRATGAAAARGLGMGQLAKRLDEAVAAA